MLWSESYVNFTTVFDTTGLDLEVESCSGMMARCCTIFRVSLASFFPDPSSNHRNGQNSSRLLHRRSEGEQILKNICSCFSLRSFIDLSREADALSETITQRRANWTERGSDSRTCVWSSGVC